MNRTNEKKLERGHGNVVDDSPPSAPAHAVGNERQVTPESTIEGKLSSRSLPFEKDGHFNILQRERPYDTMSDIPQRNYQWKAWYFRRPRWNRKSEESSRWFSKWFSKPKNPFRRKAPLSILKFSSELSTTETSPGKSDRHDEKFWPIENCQVVVPGLKFLPVSEIGDYSKKKEVLQVPIIVKDKYMNGIDEGERICFENMEMKERMTELEAHLEEWKAKDMSNKKKAIVFQKKYSNLTNTVVDLEKALKAENEARTEASEMLTLGMAQYDALFEVSKRLKKEQDKARKESLIERGKRTAEIGGALPAYGNKRPHILIEELNEVKKQRDEGFRELFLVRKTLKMRLAHMEKKSDERMRNDRRRAEEDADRKLLAIEELNILNIVTNKEKEEFMKNLQESKEKLEVAVSLKKDIQIALREHKIQSGDLRMMYNSKVLEYDKMMAKISKVSEENSFLKSTIKVLKKKSFTREKSSTGNENEIDIEISAHSTAKENIPKWKIDNMRAEILSLRAENELQKALHGRLLGKESSTTAELRVRLAELEARHISDGRGMSSTNGVY